MLKRILCHLFNLMPIEDLWKAQKDISHLMTKGQVLETRNFNLNVEKHSLEKENTELRKQAEEAVKDLALLTGEIMSLKNRLDYCKAELSMRNYE